MALVLNSYGYSYDSDGWIQSTTRNGKITTFVWDKVNNLLTSKTEQLSNGSRTTSFIYNSEGLVTQKTISTTSSGTRTWTYTWGTFGKLLSQTDPSGATTTYTYYADSHSDMTKRGMLNTISNALGHTITINSYGSRGNPLSVTLANGLTKTYTYNDIG